MQEEKNHIEKLFGNRIVRHSLFWMGYVLTMTYIHGLGIQHGNYLPWFFNYLIELPVLLGLTYFITWFIIPKFLLARKYLITILLVILGFVFFSFLNVLLDKFIISPHFMNIPSEEITLDINRILTNAFGLVFPVVIFVAVSFAKYSYLKGQQGTSNFQTKLRSELEMIRNQMHPVFLRDALDDILIMSSDNPSVLPDMILKISDILHYFLYECDVDKLPLRKEEQSIRTFLGFEKLRYGDNFDYDILIKGDLENTLISPYILFPLIRSA
ncbi:MAG: histidine kinase, partial [Bacteroidales bacterium]